MRLSTRARLTLYYAAVLAISLAGFALALRLVTGAALLRALDNSLLVATQLAQVDSEGGAPSFAQQQDAPVLRHGLITLELYDQRGARVGRLGSGGARFTAAATPGFSSVRGWRVYTSSVQGGTLQAYRSLDQLHETLRTLDRIILAGVPLVVLLAAGAGWWLSRQALAPIAAVMRTASAIADSGDPTRRVPRRPGSDEMGRLVDLINAMLWRLQSVIARERTFANAAAHELRTPLAVIRGRTELALQRPRSLASYQATLRIIDRRAGEMQAMVESLLGLARSASLELRPTALGVILTDVLDAIEGPAAARGLSIATDFADVSLKADPALLRQAIISLAVNAIKFTPEGGALAVTASSSSGQVSITVEDSGPGIAPEQRSRLLQPFQRGGGRQGVEGAGLGLALTLEVISAHHGTLELGDSPLGGLLVRIELPLAPEATA